MNPVRWSIRHFVKALADGDAKALEKHVRLPFERRYPIPKTMDEFVAAIPSLLGEDAVKRLSDSSAFRDWNQLGEKLDARASVPDAYKYRLDIYKAGSDITAAPDKIVLCKYGHEGSPGYDSYTSEDEQYQVTVNYCGPLDFAEMNFYRPGIAEDDDKTPRVKSCEWRYERIGGRPMKPGIGQSVFGCGPDDS